MISVADLSFGYRKGDALFAGLSRDFPSGTMTAITGASGKGKSTLLYLLGLLLTPSEGRVLLNGQDVSSATDTHRATLRAIHVGFVFQDAALDPTRTVIDNVTEAALYAGLARRESRVRASLLLERFGVDLRADSRPGQVSGGQAQRVALCRALLNRPSVVLADEPTGNLDRAAAKEVLTALSEIAQRGVAVVISSHDPFAIGHCDAILAL